MKTLRGALAALALAALASSCSTMTGGSIELRDGFRTKAESLEHDGALRQALDAWKVVLAINPGDAAARQRKDAIEAQIAQHIAERMNLAEQALARKSFVEARRHYLAVLALDPAHEAAFEALRSRAREVRTLPHAVRSGETLASIAEIYYGDRSRVDVLWETNGLAPNARLASGSTLLIPEIPGVPFVHQRAAKPVAPPSSTPTSTAKSEAPPLETNYQNPLIANARDALGSGDYETALVSVDRFLTSNPRHPDALDLKKNTLYEQGKALLNQRKYVDSLKVFDQLARLSPNFQDSNRLSTDARNRLVQDNYSEGVRLFREEKLSEAVARWRAVLEYDPGHANARKNIEQAERMLQNLQSQRQKAGR